jgi:hypothetical protein
MKTQRILATLWLTAFVAMPCFWLWQFLVKSAPAYDGIHAQHSLVCLFGIVACIFLLRGARWARISLGIIALYLGVRVLFKELLPQGWMRVDKLADDALFILSLVTVVLLLFRKYEPISPDNKLGPLVTRTRVLAILVLLFVALAAGYFGYSIGINRADRVYLRQWTIYDLHVYPRLYMRLQKDGTNGVARSLRAKIVDSYSYYDTHYSNEVVTNAFTNDLAVARAIFNEERRANDEWNRTNRGPNTAPEPTATAPSASTNR